MNDDAIESMRALERRVHRAELTLREMAATDTSETLRNHRLSKSQGVALALSYLREEMRLQGLEA